MRKNSLFSKIIFVFLIILAVFFMSCSQSADPTLDVMRGTKGVELTLHDVKHAENFIKGDKLNFLLEVKNLGTYDLSEGFIVIWGYDPNSIFFEGSSGSSTIISLPSLEGVKPYMPEGDSQFIELQEEKTLSVPYGSSYKTNLLFSTCYAYQTKAVSPACIITDMDEYISGSSTCEQRSQTFSSQGAPVAVTYIEPRMSETEIQFLIEVKNVGNGEARNIKVLLDGQPIEQHPCWVSNQPNRIEILSGHGYADYMISITSSKPFPSMAEVHWNDDIDDNRISRSSLTL